MAKVRQFLLDAPEHVNKVDADALNPRIKRFTESSNCRIIIKIQYSKTSVKGGLANDILN